MITKEYFTDCVGREPELDDLERCNCDKVGEPGHETCGWCENCDLPLFICGCYSRNILSTPRRHVLKCSGIFESNFEDVDATYIVEKSQDDVPNVGILPFPSHRSINVIFEEDVPKELESHILDVVGDTFDHSIMESSNYTSILTLIIHELHRLVSIGNLYRDHLGKIIYHPEEPNKPSDEISLDLLYIPWMP